MSEQAVREVLTPAEDPTDYTWIPEHISDQHVKYRLKSEAAKDKLHTQFTAYMDGRDDELSSWEEELTAMVATIGALTAERDATRKQLAIAERDLEFAREERDRSREREVWVRDALTAERDKCREACAEFLDAYDAVSSVTRLAVERMDAAIAKMRAATTKAQGGTNV